MKGVCAVAAFVLVVATFGVIVNGKIYEECELKDLLNNGLTKAKETTLERIVCHVSQSSNYDSTLVKTRNVTDDSGSAQTWTLYGIFQLSHHFCSGTDPLCGANCTRFTDDDIINDIQCVEEIKNTFLKNPTAANKVYREIITQLFSPNCLNPAPSSCP